MRAVGRIFLILFACFAATFTAGLVVTVAAVFPAWSDLAVDAFAEGTLGYFAAFIGLFLSIVAALPAFVIIAIAESFTIRTMLYYTATGGATTAFIYMQATGWNTLALSVAGFARRELEIAAAAGIIAGFVYWAIAGRSAGAWRRAEGG